MARNAAGLLTGELLGNGVSSVHRYDALNRLRFRQTTGPAGPVHRLTQRVVYQGCNRATFGYEYNALGNLLRRTSRLGTSPQAPSEEVVYAYGSEETLPHAVTRAGTESLAYNGNGNLTHRQDGAGRSQLIRYTPFNLPRSIATGTFQVTFGYDADQQRAFKQSSDGRSTVYVGGLYERRQEPDGTLRHVFSIVGAEGPVAQVQFSDVPVPGGEGVLYLHPDHLGSVESVTGSGGSVVEQRKYDPVGQRKSHLNPALPPQVVPPTCARASPATSMMTSWA